MNIFSRLIFVSRLLFELINYFWKRMLCMKKSICESFLIKGKLWSKKDKLKLKKKRKKNEKEMSHH